MPPPDAAPSLSEAPLLKVEGVGKSYGLRAVLAEVCLTVGAGERLALTGPSGSGKTTLLNCIGGVDRPDAGAIFLEDSRIDRLDNAALARVRRERIGTIFQFFHLLPTLTVAENVELPLQLLRVPLAARTERVRALPGAGRVDGALGRAALAALGRGTAAGGDRAGPRPSADAAAGGRADGQPRFGQWRQDSGPAARNDRRGAAGLVLVTHSEAAAAICHRRLHLRDGRIVAET